MSFEKGISRRDEDSCAGSSPQITEADQVEDLVERMVWEFSREGTLAHAKVDKFTTVSVLVKVISDIERRHPGAMAVLRPAPEPYGSEGYGHLEIVRK